MALQDYYQTGSQESTKAPRNALQDYYSPQGAGAMSPEQAAAWTEQERQAQAKAAAQEAALWAPFQALTRGPIGWAADQVYRYQTTGNAYQAAQGPRVDMGYGSGAQAPGFAGLQVRALGDTGSTGSATAQPSSGAAAPPVRGSSTFPFSQQYMPPEMRSALGAAVQPATPVPMAYAQPTAGLPQLAGQAPMGTGQAAEYQGARADILGSSAAQRGALGELQAAALGQAPSVAQAQLGLGRDAAIQQAMALGASARGSDAARAAASRQAADQAAAATQGVAGQAALLRAQEMATARGQYAQAAMQAREADLQRYGLLQQRSIAQAQLDAQGRALGLQAGLGYEALAQQQVAQQAQLEADATRTQIARQFGYSQLAAQKAMQDQQNTFNLLGAGLTAVGTIGGAMLGGPAGAVAGGAAGAAAGQGVQTLGSDSPGTVYGYNPNYA